jgi:hypothetical protein
LASRPGRFTPGERASGTHWIGGWVDPRAGLEDVERSKFFILPGIELDLLVVQPVVSRYTDYAIPALIEGKFSIFLLICPTSENTHTKGAQTWTPQSENNAERREFLFPNKHILMCAVAWNGLTYDLVQCDSFNK